MSDLAFYGGEKSVTYQGKHFEWPLLSDETIKAVNDYLKNREPLSIATRTGIVKNLKIRFLIMLE